MQSLDLRRQNLLVRNPEYKSALIIGAGSTGSNVAMLLARTGIGSIAIIDGDNLEPWNISGGIFDCSMMGSPKVDSVASIVKKATGVEITTMNRMFDGSNVDGQYDFVVIGVDSLEARKDIWDMRGNIARKAWIDGRMGGHSCETYAFMVDGDQRYLSMYAESVTGESTELPCGTEATSYVLCGLSAQIGRVVSAVCNEEDFPFRQYWEANNNIVFITQPLSN